MIADFSKHMILLQKAQRIAPNGVLTIRGPFAHRTISIERQDEKSSWAPGERVMYLLTAGGDPEDGRAWTALAFVKDPPGVIDTPDDWAPLPGPVFGKTSTAVVFKKHRGTLFETLVNAVMTMIVSGRRQFRSAMDGNEHPYEVMCARACLNCGRRLSHPISISDGYGPECREKLGIA